MTTEKTKKRCGDCIYYNDLENICSNTEHHGRKTKFDFSDACELFTDWFGNL